MVSKKMNHLKIKEFRGILEQDQPEFASNCGISTRTLVSVERGEAVVKILYLKLHAIFVTKLNLSTMENLTKLIKCFKLKIPLK